MMNIGGTPDEVQLIINHPRTGSMLSFCQGTRQVGGYLRRSVLGKPC
ncbi:hypothetical protein [Parabacteroides sp. Marseille-P3160]|nr:hypothetical protein [Parabacteroides sp. Marseille-P3160]